MTEPESGPGTAGPGTPTVARIVHYVSQGSANGQYPPEPRTAFVTSVTADKATLNLYVVDDWGAHHAHSVQFHPGDPAEAPDMPVYYRDPHTGRAYPPRTWHWPPRV